MQRSHPAAREWDALALEAASLSPAAFEQRYLAAPSEANRDELLRARMRYDRAFFAKWCWPDLFYAPWCAAHEYMLADPEPPWYARQGIDLRATAAPRGIAKTTVAKAKIAHALVFGLDPFQGVLSAELGLATKISGAVLKWFRSPGEFTRLFGPFKVEGGVKFWQVLIGGRPAGMMAASFGTQVRGTNLDGQRPTRWTVDDGERPDRVKNPDQRRIWQTYLDDDVLESGPSQGGLVVDWLGTVLHPDAILARLLKSPAWRGRRYSALLQVGEERGSRVYAWPDRMDLWEQAGRIWADLSLGDVKTRDRLARAFYEARKAEMDAGARVLDPHRRPLHSIMHRLWAKGRRSVLRELFNDPVDPDTQLFDVGAFTYFDVVHDKIDGPIFVRARDGRRVRAKDCRFYLRWDPSMGNPDGDYAAIFVVARDPQGYVYVVDGWMERKKPTLQLAALWDLAERWAPYGLRKGSVESNGFQALLGQDFAFGKMRAERRAAGRFWQFHLDSEASHTNKEERIGALEVPASAGWLLFNRRLPGALWDQAHDFPGGDHDDGLDAIEGAYVRVGGIVPSMVDATDERRSSGRAA